MIEVAKISSKGQVTLPKRVRRYLDVEQGDSLIFELKENVLTIRKTRSIESYFNTLKPLKENIKEKVAKEMAKEIRKGK